MILLSHKPSIMKPATLTKLLKWTARIWGILAIFLILYFFMTNEADHGIQVPSDEMFTFFLFPVSTITGLLIAFKWEGVGGLISTAGLIALFIMRPGLFWVPLFGLGLFPPGMFFMMYWLTSRKRSPIELR